MFKIILGVIMILVGVIFAIAAIAQLFKGEQMPTGTGFEKGYTLGYILGELIICTACFFLVKYGLKFAKSKG